jgi:hypothetical protein
VVRPVEILLHREVSKEHLKCKGSSRLAVKSSVDDSAEREDLEKHTKVHEASLFASYKHRRLQKDHTSSYRDFFPSLTKGRKNSRN